MKTPLWFPQSFFARTLWLVLIVVLFSKALTLVYLMMNEDVLVDRQYSHGAALTLRASARCEISRFCRPPKIRITNVCFFRQMFPN